jgi:hypothetical protein
MQARTIKRAFANLFICHDTVVVVDPSADFREYVAVSAMAYSCVKML